MTKGIVRTSAGLRDALFDAMEKVSSGDMPPAEAQAVSVLARQICNTVHLEIEIARLRTEYPADTPVVVPNSIQLGVPNETDGKPAVQPHVLRKM